MNHPLNNRRNFLKSSMALGASCGLPALFSPASALSIMRGSANDRIPIGLIGAGGMGVGNMNVAKRWCDIVAIADVDRSRCESANAKLSGGKAELFEDYRKIIERDDIKILHIATPDHWHTKPLIEAMLAGKDVYCEKPLTLTIDEGKLIRKIQKQTGRIVQVGTQQRSTFNVFTKAIALIQQGRLGKIKRIQCAIDGAPSSPEIPVAAVPSGLNWDRWLGPAPNVDFRSLPQQGSSPYSNCHYNFRWWYQYSGGKLTDWGAHHVDIALWALQANNQSVDPVSISGSAVHPVGFKEGVAVQNDRYNTANHFYFTVKFPADVELVIRSDTDNGCLIEGEKGRIFVSRKKLTGKPVEDLAANPLPDDAIQKAYKGLPMEHNERAAHWANFLHCHLEQKEPISDVHSHMKTLNVCHLAGITARLGRPLNWDAASESIPDDDLANSMLARPYRTGYEIEMS